MDAPTITDIGELCLPRSSSPEGETVCAALVRYENTLRDAIREIHVDVSAFKLGMERRMEETTNLSGPLGCAFAQLQQENRQLRIQVEALTRQVALLSGIMADRSTLLNNSHNHSHNHKNHLSDIQESHQEKKEVIYGKGEAHTQSQTHLQTCNEGCQSQSYSSFSSQSNPGSPLATSCSSPSSSSPPESSRVSSTMMGPVSGSSPSTTRFSSRATFAVSSKTNSIEREEPFEVDNGPPHASLQNGHAATTENSALVHGKISPPSDFPHEHAASVTKRMSHLPITAMTKMAEIKGPEFPSSPVGSWSFPFSEASPTSQSAVSTKLTQPEESPVQPASTRSPSSPIRSLGSPRLQENANSATAKSMTYSELLLHDRDDEVCSNRSFGQVGERRRELVRSQTLPRSIGAHARCAIFERLDSEASNSRPKPADNKPKLTRSQSFGVSSASSIKQILLEWCRSKTMGYQNIDIQNFSSSWSDGVAFCALVHSFFPTEFDYNSLSPVNRKYNFELAFGTAELRAGCDRLIEVDDMMIMGRKPDPMCVFTYVQSLYNHLRKFE